MDFDNFKMAEGEGVGGGGADIAPGTYPYKIIKVEKEYTKATSEKPARPMAVLTVEIENDAEEYADIKDRIVLQDNMKWKIRQVFESAGLCKPGAEFIVNWEGLIGMRGHLKTKNEKYKDRNGNERERANIDAWLPYGHAPIIEADEEESPI